MSISFTKVKYENLVEKRSNNLCFLERVEKFTQLRCVYYFVVNARPVAIKATAGILLSSFVEEHRRGRERRQRRSAACLPTLMLTHLASHPEKELRIHI